MEYRQLTPAEIAALQQQGCVSEDWNLIEVADAFSPAHIVRTTFSGHIRLGVFTRSFTLGGGVTRHSGISDACLHNVTVGDNCLIRSVQGYIANYDIASDCLIDSVGIISTDEPSSFGNGVKVSVLNETGGREVLIHDRLSSHEAYMIALYRHRPAFVEKMNAIIAAYADSVRSDRGSIGADLWLSGDSRGADRGWLCHQRDDPSEQRFGEQCGGCSRVHRPERDW